MNQLKSTYETDFKKLDSSDFPDEKEWLDTLMIIKKRLSSIGCKKEKDGIVLYGFFHTFASANLILKRMKMTKWNIDSTNSEASFKVRKLMITNVVGQMDSFEGHAETESEDFELIKKIYFKASVNSIKTDDAKRDEHLKSSDFFDMEKYPHILFVAEDFNISEKKIHATLTIRDITKPLILTINSGKTTSGENSRDKVELSFSGKVNRRDFGLTWDGKNAAGNLIVGDEIKLSGRIQFVKQSQDAPVKGSK